MKSLPCLALTLTCAAALPAFAGTINFDNAPTGVDLGAFYQGVTFGAQNQATEQMLPYLPAHSGTQGLSGSGTANTLSFDFSTPQSSFSFYYVSYLGFMGTAYAADGTIVGSFTGLANYNTAAVAGNPSTYSIDAMTGLDTGVADISMVVLTDTSGSSAFTFLDDLTAPGIPGAASVPDTANSLTLFAIAGAVFFCYRQKVAARSC